MTDEENRLTETFMEVYRDLEEQAIKKVRRSDRWMYLGIIQVAAVFTLVVCVPSGQWKGVGGAVVMGGLATAVKILTIREARRSVYEDL